MKKRMMRKAVLGLTLAAAMSLTVPAMARSYTGDAGWHVTFTQSAEMDQNFKTGQIQDVMNQMQPGDDATVELTIKNDNSTTTYWYMTNKVIESLEDSVEVADGGAYTYYLSYTGSDGEDVLYDSSAVGGEGLSGENREGLHQATSALEDYYFLDTLKKGESGKVILKVSLDGETQGNDYQDTLAKLQMNFAVELEPAGKTVNKNNVINHSKVVKTGDTSMAPYAIAGGIAGIILLILAVMSTKRRKRELAAERRRQARRGADR